EKILNIDKNSKIVLRLSVPDNGAQNTKFSGKFGIDTFEMGNNIIDKLMYAKSSALAGFSFHVGSGQRSYEPYKTALDIVDVYMNYVLHNYPNQFKQVDIMDIGGGFAKSNLSQLRL